MYPSSSPNIFFFLNIFFESTDVKPRTSEADVSAVFILLFAVKINKIIPAITKKTITVKKKLSILVFYNFVTTIANMNKIVQVVATPLVTFPLILIGMNAIIYQIAGKKIGKIWGATTAIWFILAAIYVW